MNARRLSSSTEEITRLVGTAPPVLSEVLHGRTRVTGLWANEPYEAYVNPMQDHVVAAMFVGGGEATAVIDGRETIAPSRAGTITFLPRGHEGFFRLSARIEVSNIYLGPDRLQACADQLAEGRSFELFDRIHHHDPKLFSIMKLIREEADSPGLHARMYLEHALDLLCVQLLRSHSSLASPVLQRQYGLAPWQVKRVRTYMRERLGHDISLQELAGIVGMSRFHFCVAFRRSTGATPYEYLTRLRMDVAGQLLAKSSLQIGDVGLAVGYSTLSAFSAAFRRHTGLTPGQFRKRAHE